MPPNRMTGHAQGRRHGLEDVAKPSLRRRLATWRGLSEHDGDAVARRTERPSLGLRWLGSGAEQRWAGKG